MAFAREPCPAGYLGGLTRRAVEREGLLRPGRPCLLVAIPMIHILRFRDGKAAEQWAVYDDMAALRQLGALPTHQTGQRQAPQPDDAHTRREQAVDQGIFLVLPCCPARPRIPETSCRSWRATARRATSAASGG